jgi:hypothetical protein
VGRVEEVPHHERCHHARQGERRAPVALHHVFRATAVLRCCRQCRAVPSKNEFQ